MKLKYAAIITAVSLIGCATSPDKALTTKDRTQSPSYDQGEPETQAPESAAVPEKAPEVKHRPRSAGYPYEEPENQVFRFDSARKGPVDIDVTMDPSLGEAAEAPPRIVYIPLEEEVHLSIINSFLEAISSGEVAGISTEVFLIGPYITEQLRRTGFFEKHETGQLLTRCLICRAQWWIIEKRLLRSSQDSDGFQSFFHIIRNEIIEHGPIIVRKADASELDWYWTIISYDIAEPAFVIETPEHSFFLDVFADTILYIDDFHHLVWNP